MAKNVMLLYIENEPHLQISSFQNSKKLWLKFSAHPPVGFAVSYDCSYHKYKRKMFWHNKEVL